MLLKKSGRSAFVPHNTRCAALKALESFEHQHKQFGARYGQGGLRMDEGLFRNELIRLRNLQETNDKLKDLHQRRG
jgi:hypothetical protein